MLGHNSVKGVKFSKSVQRNRTPNKSIRIKVKVSEIDIDSLYDSIDQIPKLFHIFTSESGPVWHSKESEPRGFGFGFPLRGFVLLMVIG